MQLLAFCNSLNKWNLYQFSFWMDGKWWLNGRANKYWSRRYVPGTHIQVAEMVRKMGENAMSLLWSHQVTFDDLITIKLCWELFETPLLQRWTQGCKRLVVILELT